MSDTRQEHWDNIFATKDEEAVSWFQVRPETSLRLIRACGLPKDARILDIGAGCSHLPDALLEEGFTNIAVLDISATALARTKARLGDKGLAVRFIVADLTAWRPGPGSPSGSAGLPGHARGRRQGRAARPRGRPR